MSNAQQFYLQHRIQKKMSQAKSLHKSIAHQNLRRLQPLVAEADQELTQSQGALNRTMSEVVGWLTSGPHGRLRTFENRLMILFNTRFDGDIFVRRMQRDIKPRAK